MKRTITLPSLLVLILGCDRKAELIDAAKLVSNPRRYAGRTVRIEGDWRFGFECSQLVVSNSRLGGMVWMTADFQSISNNSPGVFRSMVEDASGRGRSEPFQLTTVHFRGTGHFESALPGLSQRILAWGASSLGLTSLGRFQRKPGGFGHLGASPCQLTLQSLEFFQFESPEREIGRDER